MLGKVRTVRREEIGEKEPITHTNFAKVAAKANMMKKAESPVLKSKIYGKPVGSLPS